MFDKHEYRKQHEAKRNPDYFVPKRPTWITSSCTGCRMTPRNSAALRSGQIDTLLWQRRIRHLLRSIMSTERGNMDVNVFQHNAGGQPNFAVNHRLSPWNDVRSAGGSRWPSTVTRSWKRAFNKGRWADGAPHPLVRASLSAERRRVRSVLPVQPEGSKGQLDQAGFPKDFEILISSRHGRTR